MPATSGPSRSDERNTGYGCRRIGSFAGLVPPGNRLSWLSPTPLLHSRNDLVARHVHDPTDVMRDAWLARQGTPGSGPEPIRTFADRDRITVALLGDPGEGDASQYCVVPVLEQVAHDADLGVIVSDIVYPAGGITEYADRFYRPYSGFPAPLFGVPGNHDWYDGLTGFMTAFCDASPAAGAPSVEWPRDLPAWKRLLGRLAWRTPRPVTPQTFEAVAAMRTLRGADSQQGVQPGPYLAIDAGPVRLLGIDTGIQGRIDARQARWLAGAAFSSTRPNILLTGKPLVSYAEVRPCPIDPAIEVTTPRGARIRCTDVNEIVTHPEAGFVAAIGGDDHNYQRYPMRLRDGRTLMYLVAGGSGAYLSATHPIPNADRLAPACTEEDFRCYPLRGDSLAHFSRRLDHFLGLRTGVWRISPDDATTIMAQRTGTAPPRAGTPYARIGGRARLVAWLLARQRPHGAPVTHNLTSLLLDSNEPPMLKSFLRLHADAGSITIDCWAATGCLEHELSPVLEDRVRATRVDGRWSWRSATPGRAVP